MLDLSSAKDRVALLYTSIHMYCLMLVMKESLPELRDVPAQNVWLQRDSGCIMWTTPRKQSDDRC